MRSAGRFLVLVIHHDAVICHVCHFAEGKIATIRGKNCGLV